MTKVSVRVDPHFAFRCAGVSKADAEELVKRFGPHAGTLIDIYMNDLAADAFAKDVDSYPVGSIIVKHKKGGTLIPASMRVPVLPSGAGVGGMIKRAAGYDAMNGDWEYFYFEDPAKIETGRIQSCVDCHSGAASRDYVFGGWASVPNFGDMKP